MTTTIDIERALTLAGNTARLALEEADRQAAALRVALTSHVFSYRRQSLTVSRMPALIVHRIELPEPASPSRGAAVIEIVDSEAPSVDAFWAKDAKLAAHRYHAAHGKQPPWLEAVRQLAGDDW
jgi:hypothetical protein